ncbi:hypothetical protein EJB05_06990, partial [Eragrostis curvula]
LSNPAAAAHPRLLAAVAHRLWPAAVAHLRCPAARGRAHNMLCRRVRLLFLPTPSSCCAPMIRRPALIFPRSAALFSSCRPSLVLRFCKDDLSFVEIDSHYALSQATLFSLYSIVSLLGS